jgi:hypothetical protein
MNKDSKLYTKHDLVKDFSPDLLYFHHFFKGNLNHMQQFYLLP